MKSLTGNIEGALSRNEMKSIMAGSGDGKANCYLTCNNCSNSTCQGEVLGCSQSNIWQMCGSGDTGWTCTCI